MRFRGGTCSLFSSLVNKDDSLPPPPPPPEKVSALYDFIPLCLSVAQPWFVWPTPAYFCSALALYNRRKEGYFGGQREPLETNISEHWKSRERTMPYVTKLARDVLAVCSSSVPSEQSFSLAGKTISDVRNRLSSNTAQALLCLKSWNGVMAEVVEI